MSKYDEGYLDKDLLNENSGRRIINEPGDSQWGQLIVSGKSESKKSHSNGLRILLIASYRIGYMLVKAVIEYEKRFPERIKIVGLMTDDPVSPHAKISMKRRIWRLFDDEHKLEIEEAIIELALESGIPVYTGSVKTEYGHSLLKKWNPDAIEVCVFGQIIDNPFIKLPKMGIYNFHPADLKNHLGAGPQPFQDLINRNAKESKFTVHQLSEELDAGKVIGQSPPINVRNIDGSISNNILILEDKVTEPVDLLAIILTHKLANNLFTKRKAKIEEIDFSEYFTSNHQQELLKPVIEKKPQDKIGELSKFTLQLLSKFQNHEDSF